MANFLLISLVCMFKNIFLILLLFLSISSLAGSEKLIGTWKANKQATLAYLKIHTHLASQQLDLVGQALGKTTLTFDKTNLTVRSDNWKSVIPYKVISETKDSVTIEADDHKGQASARSTFEFDGNSIWVPSDKIQGYKERFDKLVPK